MPYRLRLALGAFLAVTTLAGCATAGEGVVNNVSIYQLTQAGLALQATIKGTKFWPDGSLN